MKHYFINLRSIFCVSALLLLAFSCKKNDHPNPPCSLPKPACNVLTHLVTNLPPNVVPPYAIPYQFTRTLGPDGRVNYIDADITIYTFSSDPAQPDAGHIKGAVKQVGPRLFVLDSARDTIVVVDLDKCGRPVRSLVRYGANENYDYIHAFYYDHKGRLARVTMDVFNAINSSSGPLSEETFHYDQYDNVIRIQNETNGPLDAYMEFTYDYSKPVKGAFYDLGRYAGPFNEVPLMEILGLLNTQPHHLMTKTYSGSGYYPNGTSTYYDQQVNADGYLVSYKAQLFDNDYLAIKGDLIWDCGKGGGHKY